MSTENLYTHSKVLRKKKSLLINKQIY